MNGCEHRASFTDDFGGCGGKMAMLEAMDQQCNDTTTTSAGKIFNSLTDPMATEDPRNLTNGHWPFDKNGSPNSPERCLEPPPDFGMLIRNTANEHRTTYKNGFLPSHQQDESHSQEINNNSERILEIENHVIEILSTKDCCTVFDIQKSLPAVTSPKCVNATMTNLEKKGLVKVLENQPLTWMKARSDPVDRRKSFNGCPSMYRRKTPLLTDSLVASIHDGLQGLQLPMDGRWDHSGENGYSKEIPRRSRCTSSPCLPFHKQSIPKTSESTPNGFPRRLPQRKDGIWKADVSEQELHNGSYRGFTNNFHRKESQDKGIVELLRQNCTSPGSLDLETKCEVDQTNNVRRFSSENLQRKKFSLESHERRIIEVLSQNRRSPGSLEMENEVEIGQNGVRRLSLENLSMTQRSKQKQCPLGSFKSRRDPGIIGEERTNRTNCRRNVSPEQTWVSGRRFSSSVYEGSMDVKQCSRNSGSNGETKSCGLCKISFLSKQQSEEHFKSTKHLNKIAKVTSEPYLKFCDYCKVGLNSKSQAIEHFSSGRHEQTVAKSQKAPIRNHPPLRIPTEQDFKPVICTDTTPYEYQMELCYKAITTNSVCFLPTGTGKTLVATLVLAHLLHLNPSRQIIFLVDRVLLVLQQSDYLKSELKHVQIPVSAKNEEQPVGSNFVGQYSNPGLPSFRPLRIGAICGEMRKLEQGIPIFNHDILVVTADCYRNHITNGTLRFEDSALIVLDESHHCNKDHPYNVIIRDYYLPDEIPMFHRPKILGLTASPAGELTLDRTVKKMQRLLSNLGGASMLTVTDHIQELAEKTNKAEIVCRYAEYTPTEKNLLSILMEYATKCFNLAARVTEFKEYKDVFQPSSGGVLSKDDIYPILGVIDKLLVSRQKDNPMHSLLHFQIICDSICTLQECGEKLACDRMVELLCRDRVHGFEWALDQGLPCENIRSYLDKCNVRVYYGNDGIDSGVTELLELLIKMNLEQQEDDDHYRPLVLVLVKRIPTAVSLAEYLDACPVLRGRGIRTMFIGGTEAHDWGMTKSQQWDDTLSNIQEGIFQVVVATNVDEEKLGQSTLKLIVQLDPPNSASALAQIRARARERQTLFAAICRDKDLGKKMKDILLRENNMVQAAEIINSHDVPGIY